MEKTGNVTGQGAVCMTGAGTGQDGMRWLSALYGKGAGAENRRVFSGGFPKGGGVGLLPEQPAAL